MKIGKYEITPLSLFSKLSKTVATLFAFNLFFGWMFFGFFYWILFGLILGSLLFLGPVLLAGSISSGLNNTCHTEDTDDFKPDRAVYKDVPNFENIEDAEWHPMVRCPKCFSTDTRFVQPHYEMSVYECNTCGTRFEGG
ncbi:MAG: hypothetical protein ABH952_10265 [Candidatus Omnitrophota bacterium]